MRNQDQRASAANAWCDQHPFELAEEPYSSPRGRAVHSLLRIDMKRVGEREGKTAAGALYAQGAEVGVQENGNGAAEVQSKAQGAALLSMQPQSAGGDAGTQLTSLPALHAAPSTAGDGGTAAAGGEVVRNLAWYTEQAERGDAQAQADLGRMYARGDGVGKDAKQAFEWYHKAAKQGHGYARRMLARCNVKDVGIGMDSEQALLWFTKAAELGNGSALRELVVMYGNGQRVKQDLDKAMDYLVQWTRWGEVGVHHLDLRRCEMGAGMAARIALRLHDDASIRKLNLSGSFSGEEGAKALAGMLDQNRVLEVLDILHVWMSPEGVHAIAEALRSNTTLQQFVYTGPRFDMPALEVQEKAITEETALNIRIAELLGPQQSRDVGAGWRGLAQDLMSLLEQSLIRTNIKLGRSHSDATTQRLLELQLCLSRLNNQYSAVPLGPLNEGGADQKPSSAAR